MRGLGLLSVLNIKSHTASRQIIECIKSCTVSRRIIECIKSRTVWTGIALIAPRKNISNFFVLTFFSSLKKAEAQKKRMFSYLLLGWFRRAFFKKLDGEGFLKVFEIS